MESTPSKPVPSISNQTHLEKETYGFRVLVLSRFEMSDPSVPPRRRSSPRCSEAAPLQVRTPLTSDGYPV